MGQVFVQQTLFSGTVGQSVTRFIKSTNSNKKLLNVVYSSDFYCVYNRFLAEVI